MPDAVNTRLLTADTLDAHASRCLLAWSLDAGADEFTLSVMAMQGVDAPWADAFEDALEPWSRTPARRRVTDHWTAPDGTREVRLWSLTPESLVLLQEFLPDGLFTSDVQERGWFEDPILYRRGELLLGVVSHQREGIVRATPDEMRAIAELGIVLGGADHWVQF